MKNNTYEGHNGYKITRDDAVLIRDLEIGKKYYVQNGLWDFIVIEIEETRVRIQYLGSETRWISKLDDDQWLLTEIK